MHWESMDYETATSALATVASRDGVNGAWISHYIVANDGKTWVGKEHEGVPAIAKQANFTHVWENAKTRFGARIKNPTYDHP